MTQFVFNGAYKEYRGYVFANRNPVTIQDEATENILRTHPEFEIYQPKATIHLPKKLGRPPKGH